MESRHALGRCVQYGIFRMTYGYETMHAASRWPTAAEARRARRKYVENVMK
jgi:hypothetical protein